MGAAAGVVSRANHLEQCCLGAPSSGLHLILEESGSLVSKSPLANTPVTCRKELAASNIFSLQKSNGFVFYVRDKAIASKLEDFQDVEVVREGFRGNEVGDQ